MRVNLDQIEFYQGPIRPSPSTSAKSVPPDLAPTPVPRYLQHSFSTGIGFRPGPGEVPQGRPQPLTGTTHKWNIFDFEINDVYGPTRPEVTRDVEPPVTTNMPASDILLERGTSTRAFSESVLSTDSAQSIPCPSGSEQVDRSLLDMQGNNLPDAVSDTKEMETSPHSGVPYVTAPVSAPEQASCALSDLSVVGDSQQQTAQRNLYTTGLSDSLISGDFENDTKPSKTFDLGENRCSRASNPSERVEDSSIAEDQSAPSGPSAPPAMRSPPKPSRVRTTLSSDIPVRYPSIAVVIPPPPWKQGGARTSTRVAAAVCKKRLRSARGNGHGQDENSTFCDAVQPGQKRKKRKPSIRPFSGPSDSSIPASSHCSGAFQGVRGSALLTIESNSGPNPAYFFTFVPEPSPVLSQAHTAVTPRIQRPYTSGENALLVRLKEKEAMSWSEITSHFPGRNMSCLQVHYSTKLRHKASSQSRKPRRRN